MRAAGLGLLLACALPSAVAQPTVLSAPYSLADAEEAAVMALLREHPSVRLASAADHETDALVRHRLLAPGYEPYRARGDFDGDGQADLVVALAGADGYDVYLLHPGTARPAEWVAGLQWLPEAGFFVRASGRRAELGIGSFFSDDAIWFGWNDDTDQMEVLPSEMLDD